MHVGPSIGDSERSRAQADRPATVVFQLGNQILALDQTELQKAVERGQQVSRILQGVNAKEVPVSAIDRVVDADKMSQLTGVPASWFLDMARRGQLPHHKFGKYVRFNVAEVLSAAAVAEKVSGSAGRRSAGKC